MWFSDAVFSVTRTHKLNLGLEKVSKINTGKLFLGFSSKESARVGARVFLVSVPIGQPNTQDLELKEEKIRVI